MGNQPKHDMQAGWHVKKDSRRNLKSTYGYFVDTIADKTILFNAKQSRWLVCMTASKQYAPAGNETALYADVAYKFERYT